MEELSLSRLHHGLLRNQAHPEVVQGTAEGPHPSAAAHLPEAASVCDAATALDTATDRVDPQPRLVALLVRHVLLPRELLPQIEINSTDGEGPSPLERWEQRYPAHAQAVHGECTVELEKWE